MTDRIVTTTERVEYLKRAIKERREIANTERGRAIGCTDGRGALYLETAIRCELLAEGYERALAILFP